MKRMLVGLGMIALGIMGFPYIKQVLEVVIGIFDTYVERWWETPPFIVMMIHQLPIFTLVFIFGFGLFLIVSPFVFKSGDIME